MKKALALILALTLLLTLAACGKNDNAGEPAAAPAPEAISPEELWSELLGVWVHTEEGDWQNYFFEFYNNQGKQYLCLGLYASDYGVIGYLTSLEQLEEDKYLLGIHYDAVPPNELNDGYEAYDSQFIVNTAGAAEKTILVSSDSLGDDVAFDLMGASLEEAGENLDVY